MLFGKKYKISKEKKAQLEEELHNLETSGRDDIATRLDLIRQQPLDEEDYPFADVFDDKEYLEKRIQEIKEIVNNSEIIDDESKHSIVEIGSKVRVGFEKFEEEYSIVASVEADPLNKKISDQSPIGKALIGAKIGDILEVQLGPVKKKFRVLNIS